MRRRNLPAVRRKGQLKLRVTRLLLITSQVVLLLFVAYWLKAQYAGERQELQKDLAVQLEGSRLEASNAVISVFVGDFIKKEGDSLRAGGTPRIRIVDTVHRMRPGLRLRLADTAPIPEVLGRNTMIYQKEIRETTRAGQNKSGRTALIYRGERPPGSLVNQSLRLVLKSTGGIPDSLERRLMGMDTAGVANIFRKRLREKGWPFTTRWVGGNTKDSSGYIYLDHLSPPDHYRLQIGGFRPYLLRNLTGSFLFALVLIGLTGAAFWLTYKSLREQTHLAAIRNDFISNMSHELKTPVATVKVALEALGDPQVLRDGETARDYVAIAALETGRLEQLIHLSLQTALLEEGKMTLQHEPVDVKKLVADTVRILHRTEQTRITMDSEGTDFNITGDKLQLQGVLINILDNAVKYGGTKQEIRVQVAAATEDVSIRISDGGPGIPEAFIHRVFDKFFRVPTGNEHTVKGYGLGLSYAAQVVRQHGGSIDVRNNPEGGCTFSVTLPKTGA